MLNTLAGSPLFNENDIFDGVDLEGDASTSSGGRIEVGLSYILDPDAFSNNDPNNYPFDPGDVLLSLFFIIEQDIGGGDIYVAAGLLTAVPIPAPVWLFGAGIASVLGLSRRCTRLVNQPHRAPSPSPG